MSLDSITSLAANLPLDWILVGGFAALIALDALRAGSSRAVSLSIALPLSAIAFAELSHTVPLSSVLTQFSAPIAQAVLFGILVAFFFFCARRVVGLWGDLSEGPIQAFIAGIACTVIAVPIWLQIAPLDSIWHFGPPIQALFGESYRLWWLLLGFIGLAYIRS